MSSLADLLGNPQLSAALLGALVGGILTALASALITWAQIRAQRDERQRAERRDAYLGYIAWANKVRGSVEPHADERPVDLWDAGHIEVAAHIFGSKSVRRALDELTRLRQTYWWGVDTTEQRQPDAFLRQRGNTAWLVYWIASTMQDELGHVTSQRKSAGLDWAVDEVRKIAKEGMPHVEGRGGIPDM